jgi:dienelactone hydrolase
VVGSWPDHDFTTKAAGVLETELTAAGIRHDLKVYPDAKHAFFNDQSTRHPTASSSMGHPSAALAAGPAGLWVVFANPGHTSLELVHLVLDSGPS